MMTLRWILGVPTALAAGGWLVLAAWADTFRQSWGASKNSGLTVFGPFGALAALLASLVFPQQRILLHAVAAGVALLVAESIMLFPKASGLGVTMLVYCGLWLTYYGLAAWSPQNAGV